MEITNKQMQNVYFFARGNRIQFHTAMCKLSERSMESVEKNALYQRSQRTITELNRLRKFSDKSKYHVLCNSQFLFPMKRKFEEDENSEVTDPPCKKPVCNHEDEVLKLKKTNDKLSERLKKIKLQRLNDKIRRCQKTITSLKQKVKNLQESLGEKKSAHKEKGTQCNSMKEICDGLKEENDYMKMYIDEMYVEKNIDEAENISIEIREPTKGRPYSPQFRQVLYEFRSRNIALEHINPIISSDLSLVNKKIEDLPSKSTCANMSAEMGMIAREHVKEEIQKNDCITMHRDGTTKKGRHFSCFYGMSISTENETLTAGLREVKDGKSETYVQCINEISYDITDGEKHVMYGRVKNFMTDRCATEQKTNNILKSEMKNPSTIDHTYLSTTNENQINDFKCAVHPLLQFAEISQRDILKIEESDKLRFDGSPKTSESNTHFLLRCISKLFFKDGSGDPLLSSTYLTKCVDGLDKVPLMNFRGNRFNVLFYNAAGTYICKDHIISYLQTSKSSLNFIQTFIMDCLQNETILSILRALGILCKIITEPYWLFVETSGTSALEMGPMYERIIDLLNASSKDPGILLNKKRALICGPSEEDKLYEPLFSDHNSDKTSEYLKFMCQSLSGKCASLFKPFLENGKFKNPSDLEIKNAKTCPSHNICVERLMAKLDHKIKASPTSNIETIETSVMYRDNNVSSWLEKKSEEDKSSLMKKVMKNCKKRLNCVKLRKKDLQTQHMNTIKEKQKLIKEKREKDKKKLNDANQYATKNGRWSSLEEIENNLDSCQSKKSKIELVKCQIRLFKTLTSVESCDKQLLLFSKKGKALGLDQLKSNLLQLIEKYDTKEMERSTTPFEFPKQVIGKIFKHIWTNEDSIDDTWNGRILSYKQENFTIKYWKDDEQENDSDSEQYELTREELETDYKEGNLTFLEILNEHDRCTNFTTS